MSDLKTELMEIRGIGDAKAETIMQVVKEYGPKKDVSNIEKAIEHINAGKYDYAIKYLEKEL